ncbi:MAG: hypothetical protein LBP59_09830 [Planctomycetaceae bacterium]|nr:hypothetical protein [Planctomycetaceae bacterium]
MSTTACRRDACDPSDDFLLQKTILYLLFPIPYPLSLFPKIILNFF